MDKLLDEIETLRKEVVENTQCKCVLALMLSENIDFDTATTKLGLSVAEIERIRDLLSQQ